MAASDSIRVPPDSTGKKILTTERTIIDYDQGNTSLLISVGDILTGANSAATGLVSGVVTAGFPTNSGRVYLHDANGTFQNDELLQVGATTVGTADFTNLTSTAQESIHVQSVSIADPNNPSYKQQIDRFGAQLTTFADGAPVLSPFGDLMTGQRHIVKDYRFAYDTRPDLFGDVAIGTANVSFEVNNGTLLLSNPTTTGAKIQRTSHFYHPYIPGVGTELLMTMAVGDSGKTNVRRRWGIYDDLNGAFFQLDGTQFSVVLRSSTSGSVVDTVIPQSSFNIDRLDGSDDIGFILDVTKGNIYQIDLQWLGAGIVSYVIFDSNGNKLRAHTLQNANQANLPYMQTATLPIRVEQENTGTAGSSSELRFCCGSVSHTSIPISGGSSQWSAESLVKTANTTTGEVPLLGIKPSVLFATKENRGIIHQRSIIVKSDANATGDCIIKLRVAGVADQTTPNASFSNVATNSSIAEVDYTANAYSDTAAGSTTDIAILGAGECYTFSHGHEDDSLHTGEIYNYANTDQVALFITAENKNGGTANVYAVANWEELLY